MATEARRRAKSGKKNRKQGRNAAWCKAYALSHVREKNKVRRLRRHLARFPTDNCAIEAVARCKEIARGA